MTLTDMPIFAALKQRMHWHDARQRVLSENVANADMPDFTPRDLSPIQRQQSTSAIRPVQVAVTNTAHIGRHIVAGPGGPGEHDAAGWETTPDGNSVVLEEQMMKLSENQMDHQMATTLYSRSLALLRASVRST